MSGITELFRNIFSNGFWGFIGTVIVLGCIGGAFVIIRNESIKAKEKLIPVLLLILLAFGGYKLIEVGKEKKNKATYIEYNNQQSAPSFKGRHCTGTVGCDCPGFAPITNQEVWKQSYCKHCGHKKSVHK